LNEIINKVANSGLVSFNLEDYYPKGERVLFDIKDWLWQELILKEKEFRAYVKGHSWSDYQDKYVAIACSTDAIVPTWAYMLIATRLEPYAAKVIFGNLVDLETSIYTEVLAKIDIQEFKDQRIVIKGCGDLPIPISAYVEITCLLRPLVKSIMYGEPCSTVPLYKSKD
jgi:hypothetical protein